MLWVDFLPIFSFSVNKVIHRNHKYIFLFVSLSFITQLLSLILYKLGHQTANLIISYHILNTILLIVYYHKFNDSPFRFFLLLSLSYFISIIVCLIFNFTIEDYAIVSMVIILILSIYSFINIIYKNDNKHSRLNTDFNFSILMYNSTALILFFILPFLDKNSQYIWVFHNIIEMISKLIITYSIWKLPSKSIS